MVFIRAVVLVLLLLLLFELLVYLGKTGVNLLELSGRGYGGILGVFIIFNRSQICLLLICKDGVERRGVKGCKHVALFTYSPTLTLTVKTFVPSIGIKFPFCEDDTLPDISRVWVIEPLVTFAAETCGSGSGLKNI